MAQDWTPSSIRAAIRKLERRFADVDVFDPFQVSDRNDPRIKVLEVAIAETLVDVFGANTRSYRNYQTAAAIDTAGINMNGTSLAEVKEGLVHGRQRSRELLRGAIRMLMEKLEDDFPGEAIRPDDPRTSLMGAAQVGSAVMGHGAPLGSGYNVGPLGYSEPRAPEGAGGLSTRGGVAAEATVIRNSKAYDRLQAHISLLEVSLLELRAQLATRTRREIGLGHNQGPDFAPVSLEDLDDVDRLITLLSEQGPIPPNNAAPLVEQAEKAVGVADKIKQYIDVFATEAVKNAGGEVGKRLVQAPFWLAVWASVHGVVEALQTFLNLH